MANTVTLAALWLVCFVVKSQSVAAFSSTLLLSDKLFAFWLFISDWMMPCDLLVLSLVLVIHSTVSVSLTDFNGIRVLVTFYLAAALS